MDILLRFATRSFLGTSLSRISGVVRDISMAYFFGLSPEVATFLMAYRFANFFRRLLGESNLLGTAVPRFQQWRLQGATALAQGYWQMAFVLFILASLCIVAGGILAFAISQISPGDLPLMSWLMLPGIFFLSLYALNTALLQCHGSYFLPALAPAMCNVGWCLAAWYVSGWDKQMAMYGLCGGIVFAFGLQWLATAIPVTPQVWRRGALSSCSFKSFKELIQPLLWGAAGISATQINSLMDALFSRVADPTGPAQLWYAIRIQQLPIGLIGVSLSTALLPLLAQSSPENYGQLLKNALRKSIFGMIFLSGGIIALAPAGLNVLYGHGHFHAHDVVKTADCLVGYAVGLPAMVGSMLLVQGFYAKQEYRTPARYAWIAILCNSLLNSLFIFGFGWGAASVAWGTSLAAYVQCAGLAHTLTQLTGPLFEPKGLGSLVLSNTLAALGVYAVDQTFVFALSFWHQAARLMLLGSIYLSIAGAIWFVLTSITTPRRIAETSNE